MNIKAIGYNDPRSFYNSSHYKSEYNSAIHLCATKSLARAVDKLSQQRNFELKRSNIISALDFIKTMLGDWSRPDSKLSQYAKLSEIIREHAIRAETRDQDFFKAFRLNQRDVLQTMRVLTEINILPSDINNLPLENEERIFTALWEEMIKRDTSFKNIQTTINVEWKDSFKFKKHIQDSFKKLNIEKSTETKIILHGFYFITPIQHKLFSLLKEAGYELIFLNLYNPKYPEVFQSVRNFISEKNGWTDNWKFDQNNSNEFFLGNRFASSFKEERKNFKGIPNIKKIGYEDFYEFLHDFEDHETSKETIYLSPIADELNNRIKEYHPEIFSNDRHLLSYPAPQFLFHLHKMWDEQKNTLILSEETLLECFSSGWLIDSQTNKNAYSYTSKLSKITPFFQLCETSEEWVTQADKLSEVYKHNVNDLNRHQSNNHLEDRFHRILENPYKWVSYLSLETEDIDQIIAFIKELLRIANSLFGVEEKVSLKEHFYRLEEIVNSGLKSTTTEEKKIAQKLLEKLRLVNSDEKFLIQDLSEAISLYLGGNFEDDNESDKENDNQYKKVFSFDDIDGKVIEAMLSNKTIHICGLDEDTLPNSSSTLPWPLTKKTLENLKSNNSLNMYLLREDLKSVISRYLFYSFISFTKKGKVSWLKNWDSNKKIEESFYLLLLDLKTSPSESYKKSAETKLVKFEVRDLSSNAHELLKIYPEFLLKEYNYCPRRFLYSFISQNRSTFISDFHLEFVFGNMVKLFPKMLNKTNGEIKEILKNTFSHMNDLRFEYLYASNLPYVFRGGRPASLPYNSYSTVNKQFQLLLHNGSKSIVRNMEDEDLLSRWESIFDLKYAGVRDQVELEILVDQNQLFTPKPSSLCRFCPHISSCPSSYYPVDDEQRRLDVT